METDSIKLYCHELVDLRRRLFPDIYFGILDGLNEIAVFGPSRRAKFVRLRLATRGPLHLRRIELLAWGADGYEQVGLSAIVSTSSVWPETDRLLMDREFVRDHGHAYGFHTQEEDDPWVLVTLDEAVQIDKIIVHNAAGDFGSRAWSLSVSASDDGVNWFDIYSHPQREQELVASYRSMGRYCRSIDLSSVLKDLIADLVYRIGRCDYDGAQSALAAADVAFEFERAIKAAINFEILAPRSLEWTNHGVTKPFRYWTLEAKRQYLQQAMTLVRVLESTDTACHVALGFGAVLSLVRDQDLMKHDDDVDIIVCVPRRDFDFIEDFIAKLSVELEASGYIVSGSYLSHRHVRAPDSAAIDVFFGFDESGQVSWLPGPRAALGLADVFPPIACDLLGVEIKIPRNPFQYLQQVYGRNWLVPTPGWNHNWDPATYADWFRVLQTPPGVQPAPCLRCIELAERPGRSADLTHLEQCCDVNGSSGGDGRQASAFKCPSCQSVWGLGADGAWRGIVAAAAEVTLTG